MQVRGRDLQFAGTIQDFPGRDPSQGACIAHHALAYAQDFFAYGGERDNPVARTRKDPPSQRPLDILHLTAERWL
jgi:hypothetical protein